MISERQVKEILAQYKRHGWILRRVLLSAPWRENLAAALFGEADVIAADFDAFWFSRPSAKGEAWELRSVSTAPFAMVEVFDKDDEEEVREKIRTEMETRMRERASKPVAQKRRV